jgi:mono/diheme cytochrome c family protein
MHRASCMSPRAPLDINVLNSWIGTPKTDSKAARGAYPTSPPHHKKEDAFAMRAKIMVDWLLLLAMVAPTPAPAFAANIEHGKTLVEQHCTRCHDTGVYSRPDRRVGSLEALKNQVKRCELSQSLQWPQSNIDDVVAYLDATFYKFGDASDRVQK